jgi:surface antigen Omp85-like protein
MRAIGFFTIVTTVNLLFGTATASRAQTPEPDTREAAVEQAQSEKARNLHPYVPGRTEQLITKASNAFANPTTKWHPYFQNAYRGGGFALGAGYMQHVSAYNFVDVRGSYSVERYKLAEAEFTAPRLFHRRGKLSVVGGWRDATQVGFYGLGSQTTLSQRSNYAFEEPYGGARLTLWPTRRLFMVRGGMDVTRWSLKDPIGRPPAIQTVYTPATLAGLGAVTTYRHAEATLGVDTRISDAYARRGGFYGATAHDYTDAAGRFGFRRVDYELIQHIPILRESWVISLRGLASTTWQKDGQQIPFFALPSLGGGSNLRGFQSWRFRDQNSLLLQAEWRIMVNRFLDTAFFYDAGKVAARKEDLDFNGLRNDYGFGARFHTPFATALRIDIAHSREGTRLVFATSAAF